MSPGGDEDAPGRRGAEARELFLERTVVRALGAGEGVLSPPGVPSVQELRGFVEAQPGPVLDGGLEGAGDLRLRGEREAIRAETERLERCGGARAPEDEIVRGAAERDAEAVDFPAGLAAGDRIGVTVGGFDQASEVHQVRCEVGEDDGAALEPLYVLRGEGDGGVGRRRQEVHGDLPRLGGEETVEAVRRRGLDDHDPPFRVLGIFGAEDVGAEIFVDAAVEGADASNERRVGARLTELGGEGGAGGVRAEPLVGEIADGAPVEARGEEGLGVVAGEVEGGGPLRVRSREIDDEPQLDGGEILGFVDGEEIDAGPIGQGCSDGGCGLARVFKIGEPAVAETDCGDGEGGGAGGIWEIGDGGVRGRVEGRAGGNGDGAALPGERLGEPGHHPAQLSPQGSFATKPGTEERAKGASGGDEEGAEGGGVAALDGTPACEARHQIA